MFNKVTILIAQLNPTVPTGGGTKEFETLINALAGQFASMIIPVALFLAFALIVWNGIMMGKNSDKPELVAKNRSAIVTVFICVLVVVLSSMLVNMFYTISKDVKEKATPTIVQPR